MRIRRHLPFLLGLVLAGCVTTSPVRTATPAPASNPFLALHRGMDEQSVKQLVGEPLKVRKPETADPVNPGQTREIWLYERRVSQTTNYVPTHTREVPYIDPFTNQTKMIHEPVYQNEVVTVTDKIELMMIAGELSDWKIQRATDRTYQ